MTLEEIFEQLTFGELKGLDIGGFESGSVQAEDYKQILAHINLALTALYTRFQLRTDEVIIQLYDHIQTYTLHSRFAKTQSGISTEPYLYIIDSPYKPFQDNLIKIEQVFDEGGHECFLNDINEPWSLFTPAYNKISCPFPDQYNSLTVHYRAKHPKIEWEAGMDPATVNVEVPEGLVQALLLYIGSRALSTVDKETSDSLMTKYQNEIVIGETKNIDLDTRRTNIKLDQRGFD